MKGILRSFIVVVGLGLLLAWQPQPAAHAQTPNQAVLVVSYAEGEYTTLCIDFTEEEITGYDLLLESELAMLSEASGLGQAICLIDSTGCNFPQEKCFCECQGPTCYYWSYWRLEDGTWTYSQLGSSSTTVRNGSVEGWVWGTGAIGQNASRQPPSVSFAQVCAPTSAPTAPPTATSTATQTPAATSTPTREPSTATPAPIPTGTIPPTAGPTPTLTPTPFVPPTIRLFAADKASLRFGENATLTWDVADSNRVLLRYPGGEEVVPAQGSKLVAPEMTTQYALFAASPVGQAEAAFTIEVQAVVSAPTAEPTAVPTAGPAAGPEVAQAAPAEPAVPPTPIPTETEAPTTVPTDSPVPTSTPVPAETNAPALAAVEPQSDTPVPALPEASAADQAESPLVITVVVIANGELAQVAPNPQPESDSTPAPAVVRLEPEASARTEAAGGTNRDAVTGTERAFMVTGLAFVVLTPLLFAGIWAAVWLVWRRQPR